MAVFARHRQESAFHWTGTNVVFNRPASRPVVKANTHTIDPALDWTRIKVKPTRHLKPPKPKFGRISLGLA